MKGRYSSHKAKKYDGILASHNKDGHALTNGLRYLHKNCYKTKKNIYIYIYVIYRFIHLTKLAE